MKARRKIQFDNNWDGGEQTDEEEIPVVKHSRPTARMHSSNVLRVSRPIEKKRAPRVIFETDEESGSPSPQPSPPSKKKKEVRVREVRPKKRRPRTYMVLNSDSETD